MNFRSLRAPAVRGFRQMPDEAEALVVPAPVPEIAAQLNADLVRVDICDPRELDHEGAIPGAFHAQACAAGSPNGKPPEIRCWRERCAMARLLKSGGTARPDEGGQ